MCLSRERDNMMMVTLGRQNCVVRKNHMIYFMFFFITSLHSGTLLSTLIKLVLRCKMEKRQS